MSILTIIFTKATKIVTENITLYCWVFACVMQEVRDHLCTGFSCLHHVLCTTDDVIKGPVNMEKTCPGYVEGSLACPSYRGKSQLLLRISLQNVTNCCMRKKTLAWRFRWPGHPPSLTNFSPCKHFNSPWLGEVNWPNARQSFRACVRALSAVSFGQKVDLFSSPIKQPTFRYTTGDLPAK